MIYEHEDGVIRIRYYPDKIPMVDSEGKNIGPADGEVFLLNMKSQLLKKIEKEIDLINVP